MFKNAYNFLAKKNFNVEFIIKPKDILEILLKEGNYQYRKVSNFVKFQSKNRIVLILAAVLNLILQDYGLFRFLLFSDRKNTVLLGTDISITHVGKILRIPSMVFNEDDYILNKEFCNFAYPFANYIVAPQFTNLGKWQSKKISYNGTQKLAYLHPKWFRPNSETLSKYGLEVYSYSIVRFVAFEAVHDLVSNQSKISEDTLEKILKLLSENGQVVLSIEDSKNKKYEHYEKRINPSDMHDLLAFARLYLGDSQSMSIEAALLGVPSVRVNRWVDHKEKVYVIEELEKEYSLIKSISPSNQEEILSQIRAIFRNHTENHESQNRMLEYISDHDDLTQLIIDNIVKVSSGRMNE